MNRMEVGRRDGLETRRRLLEAACRCFAEKGFRGATVAEICKAARTNVAAVNYHFGSKQELYTHAWRNALRYALEVFPLDGGLPTSAPAEERLRAVVGSLLHRVLNPGRLGYAGKLLLREMGQQSAITDEVRRNAIEPLRQYVIGVIHEILGPGASREKASWCAFSVVSQCLSIGFRGGRLPPAFRGRRIDDAFIEELADHVAAFSLGGLERMRGVARTRRKSSRKRGSTVARGASA